MLEIIAKLGIQLGTPSMYAAIITIAFITRSEAVFGRTLFLLLFTMIYNVWLKSIWQIPLPQPLEGWGFPSGHMIAAMAFWGWLAVEMRRFWFSSIIFLVLCFVAYGIIYNVYHTPIDIFGAIGFGSLSLGLYWLIGKQPYFAQKPYRLGFLLSLLGFGIIVGLLPAYAQKPHIWQALGALIGFSIGWRQLSLCNIPPLSLGQKLVSLILAFAGAAGWVGMISQLPLDKNISIFIQFLMVGLWISYSKQIVVETFSRGREKGSEY